MEYDGVMINGLDCVDGSTAAAAATEIVSRQTVCV